MQPCLSQVPNGQHTLPTATGLKKLGNSQADIDRAIGEAILDFVNRF